MTEVPQPIETAPKDRRILLWDPSREKWRFGRWELDQYTVKPKPFWLYEGIFRINENRAAQPTRWMPEPEPPEPPVCAYP